MEKKRLLVALMPEISLRQKICCLTEILGKSLSNRIPPHVTVIPPLNTDPERLPYLRYAIRSAVENLSEETLTLGPAGSFWPKNPAVFLGAFESDGSVHRGEKPGSGKSADCPVNSFLYQIYDRLAKGDFSPPPGRDSYSFMPHVTIAHAKTSEEAEKTVNFLRNYRVSGVINSIALLEQDPSTPDKIWKIVDEPYFGRREKVTIFGNVYEICHEKTLSPHDFANAGLSESRNTNMASSVSWQETSAFSAEVETLFRQNCGNKRFVISVRNFTGAKDNGMFGVAVVDIDCDAMYFRWLFVLPELRKSGMGRLLMRHTERLAADYGCGNALAFLPADTAAVGFFEQFGYSKTGSFRGVYPENPGDRYYLGGTGNKELLLLSKCLEYGGR